MEIIGFENYLIYNDGRVFGKKYNKFLKHRTNKGYKHVNLSKQGKHKTHKIHRLVAQHYIPNPENKPCVDHINRIKTDNRLENLRWVTLSENGQNQSKRVDNTSGHKYISYNKRDKHWKFQKTINNKMIRKYFKTNSK